MFSLPFSKRLLLICVGEAVAISAALIIPQATALFSLLIIVLMMGLYYYNTNSFFPWNDPNTPYTWRTFILLFGSQSLIYILSLLLTTMLCSIFPGRFVCNKNIGVLMGLLLTPALLVWVFLNIWNALAIHKNTGKEVELQGIQPVQLLMNKANDITLEEIQEWRQLKALILQQKDKNIFLFITAQGAFEMDRSGNVTNAFRSVDYR